MKIAFVHNSFLNTGGAEKFTQWLCAALAERGHDITLISPTFNEDIKKSITNSGVSCETIKLRPFSLSLIGQRFNQLKVTFQKGVPKIKLLSSERIFVEENNAVFNEIGLSLSRLLPGYDLVIPHIWPSHIWTAYAIRKMKTKPALIWICQEPHRVLYSNITDAYSPAHEKTETADEAFLKEQDQKAASIMDVIIGNSEFSRKNISTIYPDKDVRKILLGFHSERVAGSPQIIEDGIFRIVCVNRLFSPKNVQGVIKAYAYLKELAPRLYDQTRLQIVGTGPYEKELKDLGSNLGIDDRIEFTGFVDDKDLPGYYANAALVIYLPYGEPFGLVPVEAMRWGKPVIASSHGGPAETVVDGETGFLVDPGDYESAAKAVEKLLINPELRMEMGEAGKSRAEKFFSHDRVVDEFEKIFFEKTKPGK
ncbi:MAG: glycosyltransferase family 4 protein [Chloroflexi bacterium]|nr:glycosyltransferase family 4 protein [Chloroflexota bacterium]